jgi:hypothetical protein
MRELLSRIAGAGTGSFMATNAIRISLLCVDSANDL